jgi:hypothetical protein
LLLSEGGLFVADEGDDDAFVVVSLKRKVKKKKEY